MQLFSVFFLNADTGFSVGYRSFPSIFTTGGAIMKTTDGGTTWTELNNLPVTSLLNSVFFSDENTGYAAGETILKTTDGGNTWVSQAGQTPAAYLNSVFFTGPGTGYAVGPGGTIIKTTNGGTLVNEHPQANNLKIYPNPATEAMTVEIPRGLNGSNCTITFYGMDGRELLHEKLSGARAEINITHLPKGMYFVWVQAAGTIARAKMIKD